MERPTFEWFGPATRRLLERARRARERRRSGPAGRVEAAVLDDAARLAVLGRGVVVGLSAALNALLVAGQGPTGVRGATVALAVLAWHAALVAALRQGYVRPAVVVDAALMAGACLAMPHVIPPADRFGDDPYGGDNWVAAMSSMAAMTVQWYTGWRAGGTVVLVLVAALVLGSTAYDEPVQAAARSHTTWLLFQAAGSRMLVVMVRASGRRADRRTAALVASRRAAELVAARRASVEEHVSLVHDTVAATLTIAASRGLDTARLPAQARADMARLAATGLLPADEPTTDGPDARRPPAAGAGRGEPADGWLAELGQPPPGGPLDVSLEIDRPSAAGAQHGGWSRPPPQVRKALRDACVEALRNVQRHAGTGRATVRVRPAPPADPEPAAGAPVGIAVDIVDHGVGLPHAGLPEGRFGLRLSILERMDRVGGRARVGDTPGGGVTVELRWPAAPTDDDPPPAAARHDRSGRGRRADRRDRRG